MSLALRNSVPASRVEALLSKKAAVEAELLEEQRSFASSDYKITELKRKKLYLKEEIEGIRQAS
ncbi:MAG: DUF465 domain-containing protein [Micavibrio aeruginosavorus]|uniref:DUF465 domain-containing protein n=1 Tax=Micavibrio aeruginosavorus TaxID=349221 RepID=A0A2W5FM27_9BACT|nr:MAG: DUF465 domain-containing protein [Micavibrio aeruginosavorus]